MTGTKDLQTINVALRVLYRPDARMLPKIWQQFGDDYDDRILPSIVNECLKSVVAKFNASQLITQRAEVSLMIKKDLTDRGMDFHIIIDDVAITELNFSEVYSAAVESKQVAQQEAQRAQFLVEQAMQQRQQKIVEAEGEAEAAMLIGEAIKKNPGYLKLKKIETSKRIAAMLESAGSRAYLSAGSLMADVTNPEFDKNLDELRKSK